MTPEEIAGDYVVNVSVEDYRMGGAKKHHAEFKVVVHITFYSSRTRSSAATSWHIWRSFTAFRKLDEQLRKRNATHLKGIKFPPLYRRKAFFRANRSADFLESRMRELDTYMSIVVRSPPLVAFHVSSVQSQTLKAFVGFTNGFGSNAYYEQQDAALRPSVSILAQSNGLAATAAASSVHGGSNNSINGGRNTATASVLGDSDDSDDDFRSVSSSSTMSSVTSTASSQADYRWSGTGFIGSAAYQRHTVPTATAAAFNGHHAPGFNATNNSFGGVSAQGRGSWFPVSSSNCDSDRDSSSVRSSIASQRPSSLMAMTPSDVITPELDHQRATMEAALQKMDLAGVGMPPDGSCLLHCVVYEMYPLQCLREYPSSMTVVNVGAADGMAPRRIAAAALLRVKLMEYALAHVEALAAFLMQDVDELRERYETFRDTPDEQATTAELYAVASMFDLEIVLISNDESFVIDPVLPVSGLPSVRDNGSSEMRTVTFGYLVPADGLAGHYICTRARRTQWSGPQNSFAGGSYRGSVSIGPPPSKSSGSNSSRCFGVGSSSSSSTSSASRRFERIPEQRVE